jgi:hypothetical protein
MTLWSGGRDVNVEAVDNRKGERQTSESDLDRAHEERGSEHANPREHQLISYGAC